MSHYFLTCINAGAVIRPMSKKIQQENPLINLLANVVLPVFILNKFSSKAPVIALIVALLLPLSYGFWSFFQTKKVNFISLLGLLNTLFTGGFALLQLEGIWFAFKEAGFPFLIGCFVLASSFREQPFLKMMLFDTGALNTEDIAAATQKHQTESAFLDLLKRATLFFSFTFFFSALLNFVLAYRIFVQIPTDLPEIQRSEILNQQIATMTWQGYVVIFVPSIVLFFVILFFFFRKLSQLTGLKFDQLVKNQ